MMSFRRFTSPSTPDAISNAKFSTSTGISFENTTKTAIHHENRRAGHKIAGRDSPSNLTVILPGAILETLLLTLYLVFAKSRQARASPGLLYNHHDRHTKADATLFYQSFWVVSRRVSGVRCQTRRRRGCQVSDPAERGDVRFQTPPKAGCQVMSGVRHVRFGDVRFQSEGQKLTPTDVRCQVQA